MKTYYLFGKQASSCYHDESFEALLEQIKDGLEYGVFEFEEGVTNSSDLLEAYDGWDGYATITKEEYEQLASID